MAFKFKLLAGSHSINNEVRAKQGDEVVSDDRLDVLHGKEKFELIEEIKPVESKEAEKTVPVSKEAEKTVPKVK